VQDEGCAVIPFASTETPHAPLHPQQGDTHEQEADEIGNDEGSTPILNSLYGEAEEVAQAHGVARHGQDQSHPGAPAFILFQRHVFGLAVGQDSPWSYSWIGNADGIVKVIGPQLLISQ
jgi:hypothetical protein